MASPRQPLTLWRILGGNFGLGLCGVCGLLAALALGVGIVNLRTAQRSVHWPGTSGEIVHAEVEEHVNVDRDKRDRVKKTTVEHESSVVYEYRIAGQVYRGDRVRFDWEQNRAEAEATVAKYPVGSLVTVYYDPDDPSDSVLEPGGEAYVYKVMIGLGVFFIAVAAAYVGLRYLVLAYLPGFSIRLDPNMASRVDEAKGLRAKWNACNWLQKTLVVIFGPLLAAMLVAWLAGGAALFYWGMDGYLNPHGSQAWPEASGLVVASEMKPVLVRKTDDRGRGATYHRYDMAVTVEYRVLGTIHTLEARRSVERDEAAAQDWLTRYSRGNYVSVYYDPADPGDAQLTPHEPAGLGTAVLGGLMMLPWLGAGGAAWWQWRRNRRRGASPQAGTA